MNIERISYIFRYTYVRTFFQEFINEDNNHEVCKHQCLPRGILRGFIVYKHIPCIS